MLVELLLNWDKYNPRNDAKKWSWFRFQNDFFDDDDIGDLTGRQKLLLIYLFTRRSKAASLVFKVNPRHAAPRIDASPDEVLATLHELANLGIISCQDEPARTHTYADVRERTDPYPTDGRNDTDDTDKTDETLFPPVEDPETFGPKDFGAVWNSYRGSLSAIADVTTKRKPKVAARIKEKPSRDYWVDVVKRLAASDFATGKNDRGWRASFDWLIENDTNHVKVAEGKYDNRGTAKSSGYTVLTAEDLDADLR